MREKSLSSQSSPSKSPERHHCHPKPAVPSQKFKRQKQPKKEFTEEADKITVTRKYGPKKTNSRNSSSSKQAAVPAERSGSKPKAPSRGRVLSKGPKPEEPRVTSTMARLGDLCPADKAKIGELVKKLATETQQKQAFQSKFEEEKREMEARINELSQKTSAYESERESLASKFQQSLKMLQDLKHSHDTLTQSNAKKEQELSRERDRFESESKRLK